MRRGLFLLALAAFATASGLACRGREAASPAELASPPLPPPPDAAPAPPPPYPPEVVSLRLKRSIQVRGEPRADAKAIGTIAQDTRVRWLRAAEGPGCPRWIEIDPRGWICDRYLEPSTRLPGGVELPKLRSDELVPGTYGKVTGDKVVAYATVEDARKRRAGRRLSGSVKVRRVETVTAGGRAFWKTTGGELIEQRFIQAQEPSAFAGIGLDAPGAPALPFGFARPRRQQQTRLAPRTVVPILELASDGARARIGEHEWVATSALHQVRLVAPPPQVGASERWLDVDLDEQVLVAYEGSRPVFATLVSTGTATNPTPPGMWRIWLKFSEADMSGQLGDDDPGYSVATVPWTMYFAPDLALHSSYWHDRFGEPRSHGCVNLSPRDARFVYFWSSPDVPPGWSMAHGTVARPGTLVRIHAKDTTEPDLKGYARRVEAVRAPAATAEPAAGESAGGTSAVPARVLPAPRP